MPLPSIDKGSCRLLFAFDIGLSIQLESCRTCISALTHAERIKHKGHAPLYFQFDAPPLRFSQQSPPIALLGRASDSQVEITLYDFGGVSVEYSIPFSGSFESLIDFSCELVATHQFSDDARARVDKLLDVIRESVSRPYVAEVYEDYLVFQIESFVENVPAAALHTAHAQEIARLLRSERDPLSDQEIQDAVSGRVSFGVDDVGIIDWNAALLFDREPDDVLSVLEFTNMQLLELRFLDSQLDRALDRSYDVLSTPRRWYMLRMPGTARNEMHRVAQMQVDGATLFERVSNALKLFGDQYLARVSRVASSRYRMNEWNAAIQRKLDTIESIYQKVHDHSSGIRMEMLEWIVIFLIAFEIVITLLGH